MVRCSRKGGGVLLEILNECLKLAEVSSRDFVTLEPFGEKLGRFVGREGETDLVEIKPRFFKKVEKAI